MMEGVGKQDDSKARDNPFGFRPELTRSDGPHPCCGIGRDDRDMLNILLLWLQTGPPLSLKLVSGRDSANPASTAQL